MYLMYVDESGDTGLANSPPGQFILVGFILHERQVRSTHARLLKFRKRMHGRFGLKLREEIHAERMINRPGSLKRIPKHDRLTILRHYADELARIPRVSVICVVVDKQQLQPSYDVFTSAWSNLLNRFETTLRRDNFRLTVSGQQYGQVFPDHTSDRMLIKLLSRMRSYNPLSRDGSDQPVNRPLHRIVEEPSFRDSSRSLFVQSADLIAYLLKQREAPNEYMRRKGGSAYFDRLKPILCRAASRRDPNGIVRLGREAQRLEETKREPREGLPVES